MNLRLSPGLRPTVLAVAATVALAPAPAAIAQAVDYDVVYVRQPRYGDSTNTTWPEVFHPGRVDPGPT